MVLTASCLNRVWKKATGTLNCRFFPPGFPPGTADAPCLSACSGSSHFRSSWRYLLHCGRSSAACCFNWFGKPEQGQQEFGRSGGRWLLFYPKPCKYLFCDDKGATWALMRLLSYSADLLHLPTCSGMAAWGKQLEAWASKCWLRGMRIPGLARKIPY